MEKYKKLFEEFGLGDFEEVAGIFFDVIKEVKKNGKEVAHLIKNLSATMAEGKGYDKLHTFTILGDNTNVKRLLQQGHDPDAQSQEGVTPAQLAVMNAKPNVLKTLLEAGSDPNMTPGDGFSTMHVLASCPRGNEEFEMAKLLLKYGGRIDLPKSDGETVSQFLISTNKKYLLEYMENIPIDETDHVKVVDKNLGSKIDIVNLRFALNHEDFSKVFNMLYESGIEFETFNYWADNHGYHDVLTDYSNYIVNADAVTV